MRRGGASVVFGAFGAEGRWFEHTSRHVGTLGLHGVIQRMPCVAALQLNSTPVITCYHPSVGYFTCKHSAVCQIVYQRKTLKNCLHIEDKHGQKKKESHKHTRTHTHTLATFTF